MKPIVVLAGIVFFMALICPAPVLTSPPPSKQDMQFLGNVAESGMFQMQAAKMAQQKSGSPQIKDYAQKIQSDRATIDRQLSQLAQQKDIELPRTLTRDYKSRLDKLSGLSGQRFDEQYMASQVNDHRNDVLMYQTEVSNGQDPDITQFAKRNIETLAGNLQMAQNLTGYMDQKAASDLTGRAGKETRATAGER